MKVNHIGLLGIFLMAFSTSTTAQIDISGSWQSILHQDFQTRFTGANQADYLGIPLNAAARDAALSFALANQQQLYRQCDPYPAHYLVLGGGFGFQIRPVLDPITREVIAWTIGSWVDRADFTIWLDGRPHPSESALHTFIGFTTGHWEGDTLVATTTNIRDSVLTRNGIPNSSSETMTTYISKHADLLTITVVIQDPVYLTEPYVVTRTWRFDPEMLPPTTWSFCMPEEESPKLADGREVAAHIPEKNPNLMDMPKRYHIPLEAALGGAQTMYPEFQNKLRQTYTPPAEYCKADCCGSGFASALFEKTVLKCDNGFTFSDIRGTTVP